MTIVVPQNLQVNITLPSGNVLNTNLPQLAAWCSALKLECAGMSLSGGRNLSPRLKEALELPKGMRKASLLAHVQELKKRAEEAYGIER